ncbi:hypothetical protein CPB97_006066 [Podila verticillata]|nr:hypothetical protein CPB97_006066 [Podila verticillata]
MEQYVPHRIAYYPDKVVEVVVAGGTLHTPAGSIHGSAPPPSGSIPSFSVETGALPSDVHRSQSTVLALTASSSSPDHHRGRDSALVPALFHASTSITQQIAQLKLQLAQSTQFQRTGQDSQMAKLLETHQATMKILLELLQGQADSRARDEETQRMIRQVNDHLVIVRQKVDAILVQNYELHEYPIPRLFVILPISEAGGSGSLPDWVPRFTEKFRLFFLCECGEHSKADSGDDGEKIDNTTHLALHEGYELTRPTAFFERYGPYLLGMLQILQTCLKATTIAAPAIGHLTQGADGILETVLSNAESTALAVDFSIQFLEAKLNTVGGDVGSATSAAIDGSNFKNLRALEGADLRKLDSFLKNKDQDKILGNLYRITTEDGHVKWVCLNHYRSSYREASMKSFLQIVELNQGQYDPQLRKVTIQLDSAITAREFFSQLERAPAVNEIDIVFNRKWEFSSSDLRLMVQAIQKSNIRFCKVNLNDYKDRDYNERLLGRGRYESLLELLSTAKIRSAHLSALRKAPYALLWPVSNIRAQSIYMTKPGSSILCVHAPSW